MSRSRSSTFLSACSLFVLMLYADLPQLLEAEHIEKLALQLTLRNVSQSGSSILDSQGALITQTGIPLRQGARDSEEEIQRAFKTLETQSRELAKMNRSKRV